MARSVYQYEQPRCPDNWNEAERRFYNRLIETLDDIYSKYGRLDDRMLSKSVIQRIDNSTVTALDKMVVDILTAGKITADSIEATFANVVSLSAKYGSFDFETVKNLVSDAMVLEKGQADYIHITNLAATYAQAVNATIGNLVIQSSDGGYYQLDVDSTGKVSAEKVELTDGEIAAGETGSGKVIVGTHITAETLGTATLAATQALVNMIDASRINVDTLVAREAFVQALTANEAFIVSLMANEAFVKLLRTSKIVGDKTLEMIFDETENIVRLDSVEVIEGTFARTERRAGEGIHVFSEFGPKQTGSGTPSPDNIRPIEGRTGLQAVCCGRNLLPDLGKEQTAYGITFAKNADGGWRIRGTATAAAIFSFAVAGDKMWIPSGRYAVSLGTALPNGVTSRVEAYNKDTLKWFKTYGNIPSESGKYTIDILGDYYTTWLVSISSGATVDFVIRPMIQLASDTNSTFDSFAARYALQFGETVYGGKVDWAAGEMTVTWKGMKLLSSWVTSSMRYVPGFVGAWMDKVLNDDYSEGQETILCSHLIGRAVYNRSRDGVYVEGENTIGIQFNGASIPNYTDTGNADQNAGLIKAYLDANDVWVAWKLKNPCPIRLTPAVIASLNGINTVYTDADDGRIEFGHELPDICDSILPPASPEAGAFWLDRSVTPCVLRRYTGSDWETVNDVTTIESVQDALLTKQAELEAARRETALFLKLDSANKVVRIGQSGVTSEYRIDAFGSGVAVNNEIFSRFEANRALFGDMEMRRPGVGGLAFDSIAR